MRYVLLDEKGDAPWKRHFRNDSSIAVGAMDEEKLAAYAVYSKDFNNPAYIYLDYIYTISEYRERYVASDLLEYMEDIWRSAGFEYVITRIVEEDAADSAALNLIDSTYFIPLQEKSKIIVYKLQDMKSNDRLETLLRLCNKNAGVIHIDSRRNSEYVQFAERLKRKGTDIDAVSFDTNISCFYRGSDGRIQGCALIDRDSEGILVKYIYIHKKAGKYALLYMLCEMIESLRFLKKDAKISIILTGEKYINFFMYFFPEYFKSYDMWDYILKL